MIDNEDRPARLTLDEIAVLREAVRWRRASGWEFYLTRGSIGFGGRYGFLEWHRRVPEGCGRESVVLERDPEADCPLGIAEDVRRQSYAYSGIKSVEHALDQLVTEGVLPKRFSSAYRAGWGAALAFQQLVTQPVEPNHDEAVQADESVPVWTPTR